ncbi:MAG: glycoside hydrolase family 28 protein [Tenuifilaceae bacterium]
MKINKLKIYVALLLGFSLFSCENKNIKESQYSYLYRNLPFEMPVLTPPVFPDNQVSIIDFGGVPDGLTLNTEAFSKAIESLTQKGGGIINIPAGVWFTGPITLKSNINLHLEKGSLILFSPDKELYPLVDIIFEGLDTYRCQSPISGRNLTNVAITGEGTIDGNGQYWRALKRQKLTEAEWKKFTSKGGVFDGPDYWVPSEQFLKGQKMSGMNVPQGLKSKEEFEAIRDFLRPVMISFYECKNVFLQGVIFQNSPAWNIHPLMCENVIVDNIMVRNPDYSQNGDGIDLESCKNSLIINSSFDCGDDGICIKSGKDEDGRKRARACENLIVDNCKVFKGHGGFVVGSEMSGGVRNIKVNNCSFLGTDVGLRFKSTRGRGGIVENIYIENVTMINIVTEPILFDLFYGGKSAVEVLMDGDNQKLSLQVPEVDETTPTFRNIYIKNINCTNARRAMYFNGLPEMNITNINVENASITSTYGVELSESDGISFRNIKINTAKAPALSLNNVKNFSLSEFKYPGEMTEVIKIMGPKTTNIRLPSELKKENIVTVE